MYSFQLIHDQIVALYQEISVHNNFWSKYLTCYFVVYMMEICYLFYGYLFVNMTEICVTATLCYFRVFPSGYAEQHIASTMFAHRICN